MCLESCIRRRLSLKAHQVREFQEEGGQLVAEIEWIETRRLREGQPMPAYQRSHRPLPIARTFLLMVVLWIFVPSLWASQVRLLNLEEMTQRAARIFSGRCTDVRSELDPVAGREVTLATFKVDQAVKGSVGKTLSIKLLPTDTPGTGGGRGVPGLPGFRKGEEVILFLYGESALGLTSPVGFGQGKFSVVKDKHGKRVAVSGLGDHNLFRGLSPAAANRLGGQVERWRDRRDVDATALIDMVMSLQGKAVNGGGGR